MFGQTPDSVSEDGGVRRYAVGEPDVSAYGAVVSYESVSAEDCGSGVDDDIVSNLRMSVDAFDRFSVLANGEALV